MNAIAVRSDQSEVIRVLQNSLYPGAKPESVALVLSYCRVNGLDPMLKPVHIVPTNVKVRDENGRERWEWRDVLMPGISDYRIKAARSNVYAGIDEPEFGPDVEEDLGGVKVRYPEWCKVTIYRHVQGQFRSFTAKEYWTENYATAGKDSDAPNRMWRKRPRGQIAKCAEAQALRKAFPEFSGGAPTAEEMEGKIIEADGYSSKPAAHLSRSKPAPAIAYDNAPPIDLGLDEPDRSAQLARAERIMERGQPHETETALGDGLPEDLAGRDPLRDMVDAAISNWAKVVSKVGYKNGEAATNLLLAQIDNEDRADLRKMLVETMEDKYRRIFGAKDAAADDPFGLPPVEGTA